MIQALDGYFWQWDLEPKESKFDKIFFSLIQFWQFAHLCSMICGLFLHSPHFNLGSKMTFVSSKMFCVSQNPIPENVHHPYFWYSILIHRHTDPFILKLSFSGMTARITVMVLKVSTDSILWEQSHKMQRGLVSADTSLGIEWIDGNQRDFTWMDGWVDRYSNIFPQLRRDKTPSRWPWGAEGMSSGVTRQQPLESLGRKFFI